MTVTESAAPGKIAEPTAGEAEVAVVIGTGLIGASIGCALTSAGYRVHLRDHKISHARVAASLGAGVIESRTADVGVVIVAVPPTSIRTSSATRCAHTRRPQ